MKQTPNNSSPLENFLSPYAKEIASSATHSNHNNSGNSIPAAENNDNPHIQEFKVNAIAGKKDNWKEDWFGNYE